MHWGGLQEASLYVWTRNSLNSEIYIHEPFEGTIQNFKMPWVYKKEASLSCSCWYSDWKALAKLHERLNVSMGYEMIRVIWIIVDYCL